MTPDITNLDAALGVTVPARHARGRAARIGPSLDAILSAHNYPAPIERMLAEALVLTALLGSLLKDPDGQLTLQAQTQGGIVDLLVCDYKGGELRGYVRHDPVKLADAAHAPTLKTLFGEGYLAITFDQPATDERYQGIVPLEGESLADRRAKLFRPVRADPLDRPSGRRKEGEGLGRGRDPVPASARRRGRARAAAYPARQSRVGPCRGAGGLGEGRGADRRKPAARRAGVAPVPRGRGSARAGRRGAAAAAAAAIPIMSARSSPAFRKRSARR